MQPFTSPVRITVAVFLLALARSTAADPVTIVNPGFEAFFLPEGNDHTRLPTVASGGIPTLDPVPGWTVTGFAGSLHPKTTDYTPAEGRNVAYAINSHCSVCPLVGATIEQQLSETLAADTVYTLQVEIGQRTSTPFAPYRVELRAGALPPGNSDLLAVDDNSLTPPPGSFLTSTLTYTASPGDPNLGRPLIIRLVAAGLIVAVGQPNFDHVRLDAIPANLPDIAPTALDILQTASGPAIFFSYEVTGGDLPQDPTIALFWATGPSHASANPPTPAFAGAFDGSMGTHDEGPVFFQPPGPVIQPALPGTTHLVLVIDPPPPLGGQIDEVDEANNERALAVVFSPIVELIVVGTTGQGGTIQGSAIKGKPYSVVAKITNTNAVPLSVDIKWNEFFVRGSPNETNEQGLMTSIPIAGLDTVLVPLESPLTGSTFIRTWSWIPQQNPVAVIPDLLKNIRDTLRDELISILDPTPGGVLSKLGQLINLVLDAANFASTIQRTIDIKYTTIVDWGGSSKVTSSKLVTLDVPEVSKKALLRYLFNAYLAQRATRAAILTLLGFPPPVGDVNHALNLLAGEIGFLERASRDYDQALDPPDPSFEVIAVPDPLIIPEIEAQADSITKRYAQAVLELAALAGAEAASRDRALGARAAGDAMWESAQLFAVARFASEAARIEMVLSGTQDLIDAWITSSLAPHSDRIVPFLQQEGLPEFEVRYLIQLGWSPEEIEGLRKNLLSLGADGLVNEPRAGGVLWVSGLLSSRLAADALSSAVQIRVEQLGQIPRDLTVDEQESLDNIHMNIQSGLEAGIPTPSLLTEIETLIGEAFHLIDETNNVAPLNDVLDFGYAALATFQQLDATPDGLMVVLDELRTGGGIQSEGLANSLRAKLGNARRKIEEGRFNAAHGILGAFVNEVEAQRGKKITPDAADALASYAAYLRDLLSTTR